MTRRDRTQPYRAGQRPSSPSHCLHALYSNTVIWHISFTSQQCYIGILPTNCRPLACYTGGHKNNNMARRFEHTVTCLHLTISGRSTIITINSGSADTCGYSHARAIQLAILYRRRYTLYRAVHVYYTKKPYTNEDISEGWGRLCDPDHWATDISMYISTIVNYCGRYFAVCWLPCAYPL